MCLVHWAPGSATERRWRRRRRHRSDANTPALYVMAHVRSAEAANIAGRNRRALISLAIKPSLDLRATRSRFPTALNSDCAVSSYVNAIRLDLRRCPLSRRLVNGSAPAATTTTTTTTTTRIALRSHTGDLRRSPVDPRVTRWDPSWGTRWDPCVTWWDPWVTW